VAGAPPSHRSRTRCSGSASDGMEGGHRRRCCVRRGQLVRPSAPRWSLSTQLPRPRASPCGDHLRPARAIPGRGRNETPCERRNSHWRRERALPGRLRERRALRHRTGTDDRPLMPLTARPSRGGGTASPSAAPKAVALTMCASSVVSNSSQGRNQRPSDRACLA